MRTALTPCTLLCAFVLSGWAVAQETPAPDSLDTSPTESDTASVLQVDVPPVLPTTPEGDTARTVILEQVPADSLDSSAVSDFLAPDTASPKAAPGSGTVGGDRLGSSIARVADLDRDGHPDVAVGVPGADGGAFNAGAVFILSGRSGDTLETLKGERAADAFGAALASLADVNRDGTPDFAVSAPYWEEDSTAIDRGRVYVYSGATAERLWSVEGDVARAQLGRTLAGLDDTNGDGVADLALARWPEAGDSVSGPGAGVWVVSGVDGSILLRLAGERRTDRFGMALASAGDIDGDGSGDLLVGAYRYSRGSLLSCGAAYVISGRTGSTLHQLTGEHLFEQLGCALAGGRDVNLDGRPDFAVGARYLERDGGRRGAVYVYSGRDASRLAAYTGPEAGQEFGSALAYTSDHDRDGRPDLIVGAPGSAQGVAEGVYKISAASGATLLSSRSPEAGSGYGGLVADFADIDRDGWPELLVAASYDGHGGPQGGAAHVVSGTTGKALWSVYGRSSLRPEDSARAAPLLSLEQLREEVAAYDFPIFDSSEVDASPIIRRSTAAAYPPSQVGTGATGWVKVKVLVLPDGSAAESEVVDDAGLAPEFSDAALAAVRDWSFLPASRGGVEVAAWAIFPIGFAPPLSPEEQRRVDSIAALHSSSSLVVDSAGVPAADRSTDTLTGVVYYEVDQVETRPVLSARIEPDYPPPALLTGDSCQVLLRVLVNGQGAVADVQIGEVTVRGKGFEAAAVAAVRRWRYEPGTKGGQPVAVWVPEEVRFSPPEGLKR